MCTQLFSVGPYGSVQHDRPRSPNLPIEWDRGQVVLHFGRRYGPVIRPEAKKPPLEKIPTQVIIRSRRGAS